LNQAKGETAKTEENHGTPIRIMNHREKCVIERTMRRSMISRKSFMGYAAAVAEGSASWRIPLQFNQAVMRVLAKTL